MASRFVVRSPDAAAAAEGGIRILTKWVFPIAAAAAAAVLLERQSLRKSIEALSSPYDAPAESIPVAIASGSLIMYALSAAAFPSAPRSRRHEVEVEITPLGVQISSFRSTKTTNGTAAPASGGEGWRREPAGVPTFLPRESVVDAVVSEVVLSYKVSSVVVFRVLENDSGGGDDADFVDCARDARPSPPDDDRTEASGSPAVESLMAAGAVRLVPAFPGMEMTHLQCLKMWEGIMITLGKFDCDCVH